MKKCILASSVVILVLLSSQIFAAAIGNVAFSDVKGNDWFYDDVQFVYENNLMGGIGDGKFDPSGTTTRGMVVTVLYRLASSPVVSGVCTFSDVKSGSYYEKAVVWAAENAIVNGYSNGCFGPNDDITREQLAAILMRFADNMGCESATDSASLQHYLDYDQISAYAREAMDWAYSKGIITGTSADVLSPKSFATRAQIAAVLKRFCEKVYTRQSAPEKVLISYCLNFENAPIVSDVSITKGKVTSQPETPKRDGYAFLGWFTQKEGKTLFDFSKPIENNVTLYAIWEKKDVANNSAGGSEADNEKPDEKIDDNNTFLIKPTLSEDGKTVEITLSLGGKVLLSGFDIRILYDNNVLSLTDIDDGIDLQLFSSGNEDTGIISLNYSNAKNINKEKNLMKASFAVKDNSVKSVCFALQPIEIILTDDNLNIIPASYNLSSATINLQ